MNIRLSWLVVVTCAVALLAPTRVSAAASTDTLPLTSGSLAIGALADSSMPSTSVSVGSVSGAINPGTWSDTTGQGAGWHGTIALTGAFVDQAAWVPASGTNTALSSNASGTYSGAVADALVTVTVASLSTGTTTNVSWSDQEGATTTTGTTACSNGSPCAISHGLTITFLLLTTYPVGASYQAQVGVLSTTAMTLAPSSGTAPTRQGTTLGGANLPAFTNAGTTVTAAGSAQPFVSAAAGTGMGQFSLAAGVTITWDPNATWSGVTYIASAQYAITAGP